MAAAPTEPNTQRDPAEERRDVFRAVMAGYDDERLRMRRFFRALPRGPRCKACNAPFSLPGSVVASAMGRRKWDKNPNFCNRCYTFLVDYGLTGVEVDVSVLFADVRDSTTLAEQVGATEFRSLINRFYRIASDALIATDGIVDRFIGDGVVGLYIPGLSGHEHAAKAVDAARRILANAAAYATDARPLPIGVGVHTGTAFVGAVGEGSDITDFTALGDAVNATARLASSAAAGEALISLDAATAAALATTGLERRHLEVKGRTQPIDVVVVHAA